MLEAPVLRVALQLRGPGILFQDPGAICCVVLVVSVCGVLD